MHFSSDRGAPLYQRGSKGAEVRLLQQYLTKAACPGCATGVDGAFGPATEAAVIAFQRAYNLPADGIVYLDTFQALSNVVSTRESITGTATVSVPAPASSSESSTWSFEPVTITGKLPPLALPGTLGPPTWVLVAGSALSLAAFAWLLTRKKSPSPAMAGYPRRKRRSKRRR